MFLHFICLLPYLARGALYPIFAYDDITSSVDHSPMRQLCIPVDTKVEGHAQ